MVQNALIAQSLHNILQRVIFAIESIQHMKTTTTIRIDQQLLEWARSEAEKRDRSTNYIIISALERYRDHLKNKNT